MGIAIPWNKELNIRSIRNLRKEILMHRFKIAMIKIKNILRKLLNLIKNRRYSRIIHIIIKGIKISKK